MWKDIAWREELTWEGEPVLTLALTAPLPVEGGRAALRPGRYYARMAALWQRHWTGALYQEACAACRQCRAQSRPFRPWRAWLRVVRTYEDARVSSFWAEACERRSEGPALAVRTALTWDRRSGCPLGPEDLLPQGRRWRPEALEAVLEGLRARQAEGFPLRRDAAHRAARELSPRRLFLTEDGPVLFYPMGALAPADVGILEFPLRPAGRPAGDASQPKGSTGRTQPPKA